MMDVLSVKKVRLISSHTHKLTTVNTGEKSLNTMGEKNKRKMVKRRSIILALFFALATSSANSVFAGTAAGKTPLRKNQTVWLAHKGYSAIAPENTLPALKEAVLAGFTGVEIDIWSGKGGIFLSHDKNLKKTTGRSLKVTSLNLYNRQQYKVIHGKGISKYGYQTIPTLQEALALIWKTADETGNPGIIVELDVKQGGLSRKTAAWIISMIGDRNVRINTRSYRVAKMFKKLKKSKNTQIWMYSRKSNTRQSKRFIKKAKKAGAVGVSMPPQNWNKKTIRYARGKKLMIATYTNKYSQVRRLVGKGIDRVCTGYKYWQ